MLNKGKRWESCVKESWERSFPSSFFLRLPDQQSGYFGTSRNICDAIAFTNGKLFLIECKTVKRGNTIGFAKLTQLDSLSHYLKCPDVYGGFLVWFQEKGKVIWFPTRLAYNARKEGKKSLRWDMEGSTSIPCEIKRIYPKCDFHILIGE